VTKSRRRPGLASSGVKELPLKDKRLSLDETAEQSRHRLTSMRMMRDETGKLVERRVNLGESPLGWLSRRKDTNGEPFLAAYHVEAGDRLRSDFTKGQMTPMVTQNWGALPRDKSKASASSNLSLSEVAMAARQRYEKAIKAMGPDLADVVVRTCCYLQGMEAAEKAHGWPARSGKVVLKLALDRLAEYYGLNLSGKRNRKTRVWRS